MNLNHTTNQTNNILFILDEILFSGKIRCIIVFSLLINGPLLYCYEANSIDTPAKCYGYSEACRLYTDLSFTFGTIVVPSFFMLLFGILMIYNIRQVEKRVNARGISMVNTYNANIPVNMNVQQQKKRTDRSLLKMVFVQVVFLILCTAPYTIYKLYATLTPVVSSKSAVQNVVERLFFNLCTNLTYLATAMPFYIYTLFGGTVFRNKLLSTVKNIYQKFKCT